MAWNDVLISTKHSALSKIVQIAKMHRNIVTLTGRCNWCVVLLRACFKVLPRILCINTMRYTFNMVTMMKEKINTRFVFPMHLDMSNYMEESLMGRSNLGSQSDDQQQEERECCEYELVGVVVHTGTADGGHYYSFIRERTQPDKWWVTCLLCSVV